MPSEPSPLLAGIDTGGTFTDVVVLDQGRLRHCKVLSTPDDPSRAIFEGLDRLGLADRPARVIHGTTVGTNAVLEGKGARVAYVTNRGFADVLTLARQNRPEVYRLEQAPIQPPVPRDLCLEVSSRADSTGQLLARAGEEELAELAEAIRSLGVESVAINLLFSFLDPAEEARIAAAMDSSLFVSRSSEVLPEIREYERGVATWLNASVGPVMDRYLRNLEKRLPNARISVMQSAGTTVAASQAAAASVRLLLSGPAGGIAAARLLGAVAGQRRLLSLDMGGTSTDVALLDGRIPLTQSARIGDWPLGVTSVDIHTIGAGGGSIARVDAGGMLLVGPESAGANPGPACYGRGGEAVTVTDANLVLGRIPSTTLLGGYLPLDAGAAGKVMDRLATELGCSRMEAAKGVIRIANEHMARALRVISVERGHDPREYALMCFGGAGGLHACDLADLMGNRKIIIPALAGVLSAQGMLASEPGRDHSEAFLRPVSDIEDHEITAGFERMQLLATSQLELEGVDPEQLRFDRQLELRYQGQSASIPVKFKPGNSHADLFHRAHEASIGHYLDQPVELVNIRLSARAPAPMGRLERARPAGKAIKAGKIFMPEISNTINIHQRRDLPAGSKVDGPAIIMDSAATAWVAPGWLAGSDDWGNLVLEKAETGR